MIVITTPTGKIGSQLAKALLDAGEPIRVIARDPDRLTPEVRRRADVVPGSHGDQAVMDKALEGADALFWLTPPDLRTEDVEARYFDLVRPACAAISRHCVGHVVNVTNLGRGTPWQDNAGLVTLSLRAGDMLAATGAARRGLALPAFMDNMLLQIEPIRRQGLVFGPVDGGRKLRHTATRDTAAFAARLLTDLSWSGHEDVPVLGPEDLSFDELATIMSDVLGKTVRYQQIPFDTFESQLQARGASEALARGYAAMMRAKNEGMDNVALRTPETTTPTTFRQWCEEVLKPAIAGS